MSVQATAWVWDYSQAKGNARLVLLAIADAANKEGRNSCQSVPTIAKMCRLGEATVHRKISELVQMGELHKEGSSGRYGTSVYSLPMMLAPSHSSQNGSHNPSQNGSPSSSQNSQIETPDPSQIETPDPSQIETPLKMRPLKTNVTPYQNDPDALSLLIDNPINPNNSKELYPRGEAQAPSTKKRGSRISENYRAPDALIQKAKQRFPNLDIELEHEQFLSFWLSASKNAVKVDWDRAFQTWLLKAEKWRRERAGRGYGVQSFEKLNDLYGNVAISEAPQASAYDWGSDAS